MQFADTNLTKAVMLGLSSGSIAIKAQADNFRLEEGVSEKRRRFFETAPDVAACCAWEDLAKLHIDYVRQYVKTAIEEPHTFTDRFEPNGVGTIDEAQLIVRLESLARPMNAFGCTFEELSEALAEGDTDFLAAFCDVWNDSRDLRPAFSTLLSEVMKELDELEWEEALRDKLGLAHYSPLSGPEPVALCRYSVREVLREATTGFPITMPTVLDSNPWEYYFPAPKSLGFGRAMALRPCNSDEELKVEFLNSRVTYKSEHIWRVGQIRVPVPSFALSDLRERHLLALQIASNDENFGV